MLIGERITIIWESIALKNVFLIYHLHGKDRWVIPCYVASSAEPADTWFRAGFQTFLPVVWIYSFHYKFLQLTLSCKWMQIFRFTTLFIFFLRTQVGKSLSPGELGKGCQTMAGWLPRRGLCCATTRQPPRNIGTSTAKTLQSKQGCSDPLPAPTHQHPEAILCMDASSSWSWLAAPRIKLRSFMHISPLECWTPKPLFSPWVYPVFHKTLVSHCGTQPFFQSGLSKENKTKH